MPCLNLARESCHCLILAPGNVVVASKSGHGAALVSGIPILLGLVLVVSLGMLIAKMRNEISVFLCSCGDVARLILPSFFTSCHAI
jgi:hypothetical protein